MKIVRQVFIIFLLLLSINIQAYADPIVEQSEIKVTQIEVIANVPEQFTKEITVNFTLDNGTNALYTLNKANRYKVEGIIPIGNHTLNFININGNNGEYKISSPGAVVAYEGQKSIFKIDITINPDMVQDKNNSSNNNSSKNIGGNKTQEYLESTLIKDDNKSNDQGENNTEVEDRDKEEQQEAVEEKNYEEKEDGDKKSIIKVFLKKWFSAVLLLIAVSIFGVIFIIRRRFL